MKYILLTVVPFGLLLVLGFSGSTPSPAAVYGRPCAANSVHSTTTGGVSSSNIPASPAANRYYIVVCNSRQNTSALVKCRADGTAPVMAVANAGDVLGNGDCILYMMNASQVVKCIADTATTYITGYECL